MKVGEVVIACALIVALVVIAISQWKHESASPVYKGAINLPEASWHVSCNKGYCEATKTSGPNKEAEVIGWRVCRDE